MAAKVPLKLAQLAALPGLLVGVAALIAPRHARDAALPSLGNPLAARPPERFFASGRSPAIPVDLAAVTTTSMEIAVGTVSSQSTWFQVTVVAVLPDEATAARRGDELVELFTASARHFADSSQEGGARLRDGHSAAPVSPPEAAAFALRGVRSEIGIGWPGEGTNARAAVLNLGRVLAVSSLKGDFAGLRRNPLAALLEAGGARVHVEGDPAGGPAPCVDLACDAPDEATALRLAQALDHYLSAPPVLFLRAPWHPSGVTAEEGRARATVVAVERAVRGASRLDPAFLRTLQKRMRRVRDPAEMRRLIQDIHREVALKALEDVARRPDLDAVTLDELRHAIETNVSWENDPAVRARLAERLGSLPLEVATPGSPGAPARVEPAPLEATFGASGRVEVDGRRVALAGLVFHRIARGLPALLAHLGAAGCRGACLELTREDANRDGVPGGLPDEGEGY